MTWPRLVVPAVLAAALVSGSGTPAGAISLPERTFLISGALNGVEPNGASTRPSISPSGDTVAFDSTSSNLDADLNGSVRDVFLRDAPRERTTLVSQAPDGGAADGPSRAASVVGRRVAFESEATNLVAGDVNGRRDVFVRDAGSPVRLVSAATGGAVANGHSGEPDLAAGSRYVAFTSTATNLVAGDANGVEDVFVADLDSGTVERVSDVGGRAAAGRSRQPAISADGRFVVFVSTASDLVPGDSNGVEDVFVADRETRTLERVSVSTGGNQQEAAVAAPFSQVADISGDGRYVVFDSDADDLVADDRNQDTDVFLRDRRRGVTTRVSVDSLAREGDNDSFFPSISNAGDFVAFSSFAENLAPNDHPDEDVFVRDLRTRATVLASVTTRGGRRGDELVPQLLQRPAISSNGDVVAFTSTATNLVGDDFNELEDVFLRVLTPPTTDLRRGPSGTVRTARPRYAVRVDDPRANRLLCTIDGIRFNCGRRGRLPRLGNGRHVLRVMAGGPGIRFDRNGVVRRFRVRGVRGAGKLVIRPKVKITAPSGKRFRGNVAGRAGGGAGVVRVEVLVVSIRDKKCRFFNGVDWEQRSCRRPLNVIADGLDEWEVDITEPAPRGEIIVRARAVDRRGSRSKAAFAFSEQR